MKDLFVTGETKRETQRLLEFAKPFRHEEEMKNEKPDGDQVRLRKRFRKKDGQTTVFQGGIQVAAFSQDVPLDQPDLLTKL